MYVFIKSFVTGDVYKYVYVLTYSENVRQNSIYVNITNK